MKFRFRKPSIKKRIAARTSVKGDGRRFISQAEELAVAMLEVQKMTRAAD